MRRKEWMGKLLAMTLAGMMCVSLPAAGVCADAEGAGEEAVEAAEQETTDAADENAEEAAADTEEDASGDAAEETGSELGLKYAQNFTIEYLDNDVKLITDGDGSQRLLVPKEAEVPEGYEDAVVIRTPVERAMICSTTHAGLITALGDPSLYDSLAVVTTPAEDWTIPEIVENLESGKTTYIAWEQYANGDIEEVVTLNPDVVLISGGDDVAVQLASQLDEVNIPYISVTEWMEPTGEGQLEWMKLFGALYNMDQEANDIFDAKIARMDELKAMAADVPEEEKPVVAWGMVYDGVVYTQGGDSPTAKTIEDAGGIYALKDLEGEGSVQVNMEEFLDKAKDADILIYSSLVTYTTDKAALLAEDALLEEFAAYQNDRIYVYGKDYYINSTAVDEKFSDMVAIIHPELMEGYELMHSVKLPDAAE